MFTEIAPLLIVAVAIVLLLGLIMWLKLNTFVSLIITAIVTGIMLGMPLSKVIATIETGMGSTLGHIALIFGLGAMLGKLLADGGGATRIAHTLIDKFGQKRIQWAVVTASFIIGIALFFEVGLVLLIPIVFTIAKESKVSTLFLGIPMTAALSVTHGFLPPHPGPVMIAKEYGADIGQVLLFGFIVAIPVTIIAGPIFTKFARKVIPEAFSKSGDLASLGKQKSFKIEDTPGFAISALTALLPVFIMLISTVVDLLTGSPENPSGILGFISFLGEAGTAMLISVLFAIYSMGVKRGHKITEVMDTLTNAIYPIGMMLLIIGGGGAFKQILIDGGVGKTVEELFTGTAMSPILLAWIVAAVLRLALGSATVAAISTVGIVMPLLEASDVNLALVVLATGAGSVIASHVNDAGFWMFKEYFGLTMKETFLSWTLLETVISVSGIIFILFISLFV
ncbi:gluconate:H+ symporter [Mammaliicoccus vitulinus]|uniref:Gluconate permease n=1 Tax=Mammaliicoccus vitulinus TaxID=71237 RepID=A0ABX7HDG7_9STAP|nr:gluconate:H+ symporter [Mammaliicoccus vitulinus]PNZ36938.1 gluconate permease [Mammaliicoccus vitulinus]QRO84282.1 gluconate permease [Mammaliicoccus vitulinus]QTN11541.1 gluconate permease [Mammaliicoccus vitulinus]